MPLTLEVFESPALDSGQATIVMDGNALEEARLAAYDSGYAAGWEDASTAQNDAQSQLQAGIAQSLQALGFTFQEARAHVLRALEPLLRTMVEHVLPDTARELLCPILIDVLRPFAESLTETPVRICLHPAARASVEASLADAVGLPFEIIEDLTLGQGQIRLGQDMREMQIDLDRATAEIAEAVNNFFATPLQEERHYG